MNNPLSTLPVEAANALLAKYPSLKEHVYPSKSSKRFSLPCVYVGEKTEETEWYCSHPKSPLGEIVSAELGCGNKCPGFTTSNLRSLPCISLGETVNKANCNCRRNDTRLCLAGHGNVRQNIHCETCTDYKADYSNYDFNAGVVIGHYTQPSILELQLKVLRHNNSNVPILVHDDWSPEPYGSRVDFICKKYGVELVRSGTERIGHAGGDLGCYYHGIQWAAKLGLRTLIKLSMRFIINKKDWVVEADRDLHEQDSCVLCDKCFEGRYTQPLRTEAIVFDVEKWNKPKVLEQLYPRRVYPYSAEIIVFNAMKSLSRNYGVWKLLGGPNRYKRVPDVLWHCSNSEKEYRDLAAKFGLKLDDDFFGGGHPKNNQIDWG